MGQILFTAYPFEPFEFLIRKNVLPSQKQTFKRKNKVSIPYSCISSRQLFLNNVLALTLIVTLMLLVYQEDISESSVMEYILGHVWSVVVKCRSESPFHLIPPVSPSIF